MLNYQRVDDIYLIVCRFQYVPSICVLPARLELARLIKQKLWAQANYCRSPYMLKGINYCLVQVFE